MGLSEGSGPLTPQPGEEQTAGSVPAVREEPPPKGRIRRVFSGSRELVRIAYRDPEHVSERLTLYTAGRLGDLSQDWASSALSSRPDDHRAKIAEELRTHSAHVARIDGAIAGTPFFIALVPGYFTYLVQEMRMTLRTAALYDHDPKDLRTSAEMLALRGIHPTVDAAEAALTAVREKGLPERPQTRRSLRTWVHSVYLLLVFGGFMSPSAAKEDKGTLGKIKAVFSVVVGVVIWATTWVFPVTFMVAMAWGCETHVRQLGRRTLLYYDGEATSVLDAINAADERQDRGHDKRAILRAIALFLSIAVPIGFIAYVDHVHKQVGFNWLGALGALVALSLVIATAVVSARK
ncbi:MAG: hypothetical protein ACJ780_06830 [Solirubrobacteraceae bacterium]